MIDNNLTSEQKHTINAFAVGCKFDYWTDTIIAAPVYLHDAVFEKAPKPLPDAETVLVLARGFWQDVEDGETSEDIFIAVSKVEIFAYGLDDDMYPLLKSAQQYLDELSTLKHNQHERHNRE